MAAGDLVQDPQPNLIEAAHRDAGAVREYEFVMPLNNASLGDTAWARGRAYQIAVLVGPGPEFAGVTDNTWMSDQVLVRVGGPSTASIYHPPFRQEGHKGH
ncbi:MAG: hypothetical protein HYV61_10175 [Candidatus Rokubacteria bacterium]|nr:hypothetical protein [Candidatus Rokubacteria bacterium]